VVKSRYSQTLDKFTVRVDGETVGVDVWDLELKRKAQAEEQN
jgi:hypothetical protein